MSLVQAVVELLILAVHSLLVVLQYCPDGQLVAAPVATQLPFSSQLEDTTPAQSVLHLPGQAVADPGNTQEA
jgi:hypothetical protein